jgi:hypothetical protein
MPLYFSFFDICYIFFLDIKLRISKSSNIDKAIRFILKAVIVKSLTLCMRVCFYIWNVQYSCNLNIVRSFDKGKIELTNLGDDVSIGRAIFDPGWSWEKCVKPIAKTESCQAPHNCMLCLEE